jgi:hypothetical protein
MTMDIVLGAAAALVSAAYVCRLDMMQVWTARMLPILLHLVGFGLSLWAMAWAMTGRDPGAAGWAAVGLAGAWIAVTWPQWRHGVPAWARRPPC